MRKLMKLIAITAMTALLLFALMTCAAADEKIYTSPTFRLPAPTLEKAEEILDAQEEANRPEEPEETDEDLPDEDEEPGDEEGIEELEENAGEVITEPTVQKREVIIRSSQGEVVTEGEVITLRSELRGFGDDEQVTYQWQVDRGEGNGWEDVEGATKDKHIFIADRTTIQYSWRLIVNVIDE